MSVQEIAAPTIPCLSAQPSWHLSNAAEHWPRRLILSHQRIARDDCEPSHVGEARWSSHSFYVGSGDKRGLEAPCNLTRSKAERHTVESSISGHGGLQAPSNYSLKREPVTAVDLCTQLRSDRPSSMRRLPIGTVHNARF